MYMENDILKLINNNNWLEAIDKTNDIFESILNGKNIFHYACIRGNKEIIKKYIDLNSVNIYNLDDDGNTGGHLLALNNFYDILIELVDDKYEMLKIKNNDDKFIFNIVEDNFLVLDKILDIMNKNKITKYLNYINNQGRTLSLNVIDLMQNNESYENILIKLNECNIDWNIPKNNPPLIYMLYHNMNGIDFLLDKIKPNVNIISSNNYSPLIMSLIKKNKYITLKLLDFDEIDVNYGGKENKFIPIILCIKNGYIDVVNKFITKNINYDIVDDKLNNPIYYLLKYFKNNYSNKYNNLIKHFVEHSNMHNVNITNTTPLSIIKKSNTTNVDKYESKINIPIDKKINEGTPGVFASDYTHSIIYTFVMFKKYDNLSIPMRSYLNENQMWNKYTYSITLSTDNYKTHTDVSNMVDYLTNDVFDFYECVPSVILWRNKYINFVCPNIELYIKRECEKEIRFIIIKLVIFFGDSLHANIVIFDKIKNKVIRYEPYGTWEYMDTYQLDQTIIDIFKKSLKKTFKYIKPNEYLEKTNFQTVSKGDNNEHKNIGDPVGYCLAWCMWFVELKILNPNIEEKDLVERTLKQIVNDGKPNDDNPLLTHIRMYAKNLIDEKNKLLTELGIDSYSINKLVTSNSTLFKLQKYTQDVINQKI